MGLHTRGIDSTRRFKRRMNHKLIGSHKRNYTPPATPFNNTSFLIGLQQHREQEPASFKIDQYGSMENMIASSSFGSPRDCTGEQSVQMTTVSPPIHTSDDSDLYCHENFEDVDVCDSETSSDANSANRISTADCNMTCTHGGTGNVEFEEAAHEQGHVIEHPHHQPSIGDNFDTLYLAHANGQSDQP